LNRLSGAAALIAAVLPAACSPEPAGVSDKDGTAEAATPASGPLEGFVTVDRLPMPTEAHLVAGREIWGGTCQACHGLGLAGSPKITDVAAWGPRIAKGRESLYRHAIEGHIGPTGTMMPERGGNAALTDAQIRQAVDYMIANSDA
jgi:cytochrome c5